MNVHPLHDNMYLVKSGSNPNKEYLVATDENDGRGECRPASILRLHANLTNN